MNQREFIQGMQGGKHYVHAYVGEHRIGRITGISSANKAMKIGQLWANWRGTRGQYIARIKALYLPKKSVAIPGELHPDFVHANLEAMAREAARHELHAFIARMKSPAVGVCNLDADLCAKIATYTKPQAA